MSKIVLDEITSGYQLSKVNENFQKIEDELNNKVLYRNAPDGEANTVEKDIDLNGKKLYNVGDIQFQGFDSLEDLLERTTTAAEESEVSKDAAEVAAENAAISAAAASTYSGSAVVRTFSGDGSTVAFNLTAIPRTKENTQVYIGSVYQRKSTYSVTDNILTFNTAPPVGTNNIEVVIFESVFVAQSGYTLPVLYEAGIVLSQYNQLIEYNSEFYKLKAGQAPYTTTGTWGTDSAKLVAVGDAALRQELAAGDGASKVGYRLPGGVVRDVAGKLGEFVSVKDYGAVGDGVTNDTTAIQNALNDLKATGITLQFEPGKTYLVNGVSISSAGGNNRSNFRIEGNGALLKGATSAATLTIHRAQGMVVSGLRVAKHSSATYATVLDSFWFANFTECSFGETKLHAGVNWGVYWNEFNGCTFASLHFDLTDYTINHNIWKGGQVGAITKTNAGHATFKEAYNNVFIGVDIVGAIDWRDASSAFHDPLVLRDCNMEYSGVNYGYIIAEGGRSNPVNAASTRLFPEDDLRSEFNQQYSGSSWVTGWYPWSSTNLFRGGACQKFSPDIGEVAVDGYLSLFADATSPTGNGYCYRLYHPGTTSARIRLRMPVEFLEQAKKVGFVTFSLWVYNVVGGTFIANTTGSVTSGDAYPAGYTLPANQWVQRFITIPVGPSATDVALYIGGGVVTGIDVRVANICCTLGKIARPYTPAPGEPHPKRAMSFSKSLVANGTAQNTFTLSVPSDGRTGRVRIKAFHANADSVGIYEGQLTYARQNGIVVTNIVQISKAQSGGYGGGNGGCIDSMAASASGGVITVTTTITSYSGSPGRSIAYELEFLDRNETVTVL